MMKTKKNLQAVYFFMCMKVHWWSFQRNPTPNNDIIEKKTWCQSPSAAACHQQKPTKATQLQPTKPANWKHIHPTEKTLKKSVDFFSLKITESTNHPNKKSVNFFVSWKSLKAQSNHPTEKTVNFFVSLNSLKAQSITQLKKRWTLFCCFWVTKIRAQVSSVGLLLKLQSFYLVVNWSLKVYSNKFEKERGFFN